MSNPTLQPPKSSPVNSQMRNIGIIAHVDAGKTTLSERILFYCQAISILGDVQEGTAVMDYLPEEQKRGITIGAACISCFWRKCRINLVDTPGHVDFTGEVGRILRVIDGAVVVFSAVDGVEPQSETVWRQANQYHLPRLVFINKIDRKEADFAKVYQELKERLRARFVLLTLPFYEEDQLVGLIDLVHFQELYFDPQSLGAKIKKKVLDRERQVLAQKYLDHLLEEVCEVDEDFMALWADDNWQPKDLEQALAKATKQGLLVPVYCGSALHNMGVQPLLDGVVNFLPGPTKKIPKLRDAYDQPYTKKLPPNDALGLVFKVVRERGQRLAWMRIYAGKISTGDLVYISRDLSLKSPIKLYRLDAEQFYALEEASLGDIVAFTGPSVQNGDTCSLSPKPVFLEPLPQFFQVLAQRLEPKVQSDYALLERALNRYCDEDLTLNFVRDEASGAFLVYGMGELHFQILKERLQREYDLTPIFAKPQVLYRESINSQAEGQADFILPVGDFSQHGAVTLQVDKRERGLGNNISFSNELLAKGPAKLLDAARDGVKNVLERGVLADWPLIDVQVEIKTILASEDVSTLGTQAAAEKAVTEALLAAHPFILWPLMRVSINVPEKSLGAALHCFESVGLVKSLTTKSDYMLVIGEAPLEDLLDLATKLRSATQGRAHLSLEFLKFEAKPK
ncbi:MAG: GTP-binding protein [Desulfovibrionaceae bacterium]|nr:GTP-binding protein [Desulfovibrionaceae bacterium]